MTRYIAFAWPPGADDAHAQATAWSRRLRASDAWRPALQRPGLEVWTARGRRLPVRELVPGGAVAIGDLFERRGGEAGQPAILPGLPAGPEAAARRLAADAWGAYVALLPDPRGDGWHAFRDPSGALGALAWRQGDVCAVSDDVALLPPGLGPADLALDWRVIAQIMREPYSSHHLSPLAGFAPVAPGELQRLDGPAQGPVAIWRPSRWVSEADDVGPDRLRDAVRDAVSAFAAVEPRFLVEVSGGLDSAIVAAALAEAGHAGRVATAINLFAARREGDERAWASAVCQAHGLPLETIPQRVEPFTEADFSELSGHASPAFAALDPAYDRALAARVAAVGASAIFGGQGGDAVFFQMPTPLAVSDLLRARGPRGLADPFVCDVARWLRRSAWWVVAQAVRRPGGSAAPASWSQFWGPRTRAGGGLPPHPWLRDLDAVPPGKAVQIGSIVGTLEAWGRSRRGGAANIVQPLLSQPVLELCLRIPSWRLLEGGRERGFARRAFAPWLPPEVADRRAKGALATLYARRTAESLPFLREHLLDGVLVDAGVLDRAAVDASLTEDDLMWRADGMRLSWAAMLESWVRRWQGRAPDRPGAGRW